MNATDTGLSASDFSTYFQELWGYTPYQWQQDIAESVLSQAGIWPKAIALPTAAGKTVCLDIAVFALAALSDTDHKTGQQPRRIFYTVDRRNIVDQTYQRAKSLAKKLNEADSGILKAIANRLRLIAGGEETRPLAVHQLRGGIRQSSNWERDPRQPAIITTTVDQVGSALLFSAYGKGTRTRPVHAGLTANDSIIILDEAHCSQPFLQTVRAVEKYRMWAERPLHTPFQTVIMSATPPQEIEQGEIFQDTSDQPADPGHPLGKRNLARKLTTLKEAKRNSRTEKELADAALEIAGPDCPAVVVFANRVATARKTRQIIRERNTCDVVLMTGRMRHKERDERMEILMKRACPDPDGRDPRSPPSITVATQTLEIGADLDFDGLVTECASLDALQQRFGRLNRTGRDIRAPGRIIMRADQVDAKNPDPIYGEAVSATWKWLKEQAGEMQEVDMGITGIRNMLTDTPEETRREMNIPARNATVMLPSHIDAWAQTSPGTGPAPRVETYLHGREDRPADVQVCWRAGLDLNNPGETSEILQVCPPNSLETLPVPLNVFRQWLAARLKDDDTGDAPSNYTDRPTVSDDIPDGHQVIRWRGRQTGKRDITANPQSIRPGDTIVIPTNHPGDFRTIADLPDYKRAASLDIGDNTNAQARGRPTLRISEELLAGWPDDGESPEQDSIRDAMSETAQPEISSEEREEKVRELLEALAQRKWPEEPSPLLYLTENANALLKNNVGFKPVSWSEKHLVIEPVKPLPLGQDRQESPDDEDDVTHSRRARRVTLEQHSHGVAERARKYALACGITGPELEAIQSAALLHDVGKADPLFQKAMHGGNPYYGELLAKSPNAVRPGVRHELMSVRMAESQPELLPEDPGARDLALHLIAGHHGHCRPFAPFQETGSEGRTARFTLKGATMKAEGPTELERLDSGVSERYWRLTLRYGWWGLAYLEAILRTGDWSQSENEELRR